MSIFIYPYRKGSRSVLGLKESLGAKIIKLDGSNFKGSSSKKVINWGNSEIDGQVALCEVLNPPQNLKIATNKRTFFESVKDKNLIPEYTTSRKEAFAWLEGQGKVVVREKLTGHSGEGIVLLETEEHWENYDHGRARLYVKYIPKKDEFRVHVFKDKAFDIQRKAISKEYNKNQVNHQIRNLNGGYIYARNESKTNYPKDLEDLSVKIIKEMGLDFGAVDIIYNAYRNKCYVLEINTAPGLTGTTLTNYAEQFASHFKIELATPKTESLDEILHRVEVDVGDTIRYEPARRPARPRWEIPVDDVEDDF